MRAGKLEAFVRAAVKAEAIFRRIGITFAVYGEGGDPERLIPFDLIPRVFSAAEWRRLDRGIRQRARALNAFLYDVYHRGEILKAVMECVTFYFVESVEALQARSRRESRWMMCPPVSTSTSRT